MDELFEVTEDQRRELGSYPQSYRDAIGEIVAVVLEHGGAVQFVAGPPESIELSLNTGIKTTSDGKQEFTATVGVKTSVC